MRSRTRVVRELPILFAHREGSCRVIFVDGLHTSPATHGDTMTTDYVRSLRSLADSQTRRLSPGDLERGPVYAAHACQAVAAALAEYIRADHRCDVSDPIDHMASAERDYSESESDVERADALQAWDESRADAFAAIAEQRLAWSQIVDIARVALIMLDEVQGEVVAESVGEAAQ